jgi:hypothetical protein
VDKHSELAAQWGRWLHRLVMSFVLIRMLHDNSGPVLIVPRMIIHHAFCLHTSKEVSGVALLLRVATLHAGMVGSVNLYLFDRATRVRWPGSLQHMVKCCG